MTHPFSLVRRLPRLVALLSVVGTIVCMAAVTLAQAPADGPKGRRGSSRSSAARAAPAAETKPAASASAAPAAPAKPPEAKPAEAKPAEAKPAEAKPAEAKPAEAKPPEAKPAEAKPAEAKPPEAKPAVKPAEPPAKKPDEAPPEKAPAAAPEKPAKAEPRLPRLKLVDRRGQPISLIMLAHPSMAERLKLSDEQKAKIAALMIEREGALAKVPGPQRSRIIDQYDQRLAAVLTDAQREDLINNPPEPLLRFNYRFQRWIDVLEEVARQAGLSLVLPEAPPPGTLNYSDSKDYTATEAIDLVNGVLSAKGYTLIRREKMLLVVDMSEGIPEGMVPRILIDELGARGKFEMVSVLFPLKGRTPATVETEIKPLLGPYGKIVPLPATGQLLITDTAGIMKVISALIESIPVPPTPQPPVPAKPEPLEPQVYNVKTGDPISVMKVIQALVPNANIVPDAKARQLTVVAGPTVQGIVKKVIDQIEKAAPPDQQPRLETYPIDESMATQLTTALRQMVPGAIVTVDAVNAKLVAWATPEEQTTIKEAAEKLAPLPTGERSRQFEVYRLTRASPSTILSLLKSLLPNAKMAVEEGSRTLVVIAPATDQKVVKNLLEQLQPEKPGPDTPELRFYALKPHVLANAEKIAAGVEKLSPRIQATPDPTNRRLMVVAPPADQERIKQFLEEYDKKTPEPEKSTLVVYPVTGTQRKRFQSVLTKVQAQLPGMQVLEDTGPGELAIWARPDQQKVVAELLEQLKTEASPSDKHTLMSYPIEAGSATNVLDMLKKLHPNLQVFPDAEGSRVFVWAHPTDQAAVKNSLEQIQAPAPPEKQPRFDAYAIYGAEPKAVVAQLQVLVPNAKLTYDAKTSRLVAFGTAAEHDLLKAAIAKLIRPGGTGIEGTPQLEVYPLTRGDGDALLTTLQNVVPQARLTLDAESKRLIAIAVPEDQKVIKRVLDQIESDKPVPNAPELRFYPLSQAPPATMVTLLQTLAPKAKITLETGGKRLSVVASPADHVTVKAAVEQMDKMLQLEEKGKLVTYPVTPAQRRRFESMVASLSAELPGIQVLKDTEPSELSIWAKPSQHVAIAEILDQLKRDGAAGEKLQLAVYPIRASDPDSVMTVLKNLFPNAQFTLDKRGRKIMVWTTPSEQEQIKASVETLDAGGAGGAGAVQEKLTVYPVTDADPTTVVGYLEEQVPDAKLTANARAGTVLAWARPADHQTIAKILKDLESGSGQKPQAVVYPVGNGDAKAIWLVLHNLLPKATVVVDPKTGSIAATATAREHEMIRSVVEQMSKKEIAENAPRIVTYTIDSGRRGAISSVISILTEQYPAARFVPGLDRGQILAWARPAEQEKIKATIDELVKQVPQGAATKLVIYNLESGGAGAVSAAASILRYMFPEAYFAPAGEPGKLIAAASPADHVRIQSVISDIGKKEPPETAPRIVVYRAKSAAPVPGRRGAYAARAEFGAIPMLRTMFPEAQIAPGAESDQIVVLARPAEHEKIKVAIDQLSTDDPAIARRMAVYAMESPGRTGAAGIVPTLAQMFPDAQFSAGNEPDKVVVWARSDDHKPIETAIQQLSKKEPPEKAPKVAVYQFEAAGPITPTSAISLLTAMYPEAQFSSGQEPGTIIALARQADHDKIKATIAEMSQKGPADKVRKMVIYTVATGASSASPYYAVQALSGVITTLTQMFPNAKFAVGPGSEKVIAWALPEDHKRIAETIAEITKPEPSDKAFKMVVYTVPASTVTSRLSGAAGTTTGSAGVIAALTAMFPSAKFSQGPDPEQVIAWARPDDHKLIAEMVNELVKPEPEEKARMMVVYTVPTTPDAAARFSARAWAPGTGGAIAALTAMFPHAKFYPGPTSDKVFAWARPDEHKEIAEVVQEMSRPEPAETARKIAVYTVPTTPGDPAGTTGALALLSAMFPDAKFSPGAEPGTVVAWARPEDHKVIAQAVEEVSKKPPPGKARTMVSYTLESSGRYGDPSGRVALIQSLRQAFSDALFFPGATRGRVVVWARPDDHAAIKNAFEEMSKREPLESAPRVESYEVAVLGGTAAMTMLSTAYPEAQFSVGDDPNALIVRARPADHELIKATIEQIEATGKAGAKRTLVVYPFKAEDLLTFTDKLDPVLKRRVQLMPDEPRNRLLVWADPKYHQALKQAIDEFTREASKGGDPVSQVYRLDWADPKIASQVIANVVPNAKVTLDATNRSLVVHAMPEEQARIKATVQQIDNLEGSGMAPGLEIHRMKTGSPDDLLPVLQGLFQMHPEVQLSADRRNESIVAFCTPAQHKTIRTLIEQLEKGMAADSDVRLQTYPLGEMYGYDVVDTLTTLLEKQGITAELSIESRIDSLLVIARPEAHKLIQETLEKLKAEERTLQIVQLEVLDPSTAQLAIGRLFGGSLSYRSTDPDVEIDEATEQLFIRATAAQHVKIRELLAKMGETGVAGDADGRTRRSRVIPIRGDVPKTVEQLQKVWPQLRSNPLQVIPAQGQPKKSGGSGKSERFGKSGIQKADGPMGVPPGRLPKNEVRTAKSQEEAAADTEGWRPAKSQGEAAPADEKPAVEKPAAEKPVLIIPGSRSITVTSDDPEALDQIDKLLRALTQQRGPIGRNYNVYMLQNANAIGVAAILQNFFRSQYGGRFMRANQVTIVPDERLNAIIAYAGRADRITIENLLDVLDSAEIAQPLAFDRLQFIPVENTPADRMAQVLQELYGTQVGAISVEENTNSLVVMAAPSMVEHLQQVVEKLDEAAGAESDRTVEIISLRNSSSDRVEAALNMLMGPRLQAAARTAPRTPRSATPGAPAVAGITGQPTGPMTPTSPRGRTRRGAGAAGMAGASPAYRRSAQPTPRPSYRPAMPSGTAASVPAPMQPTVPRARTTPRAGSPATGQGMSRIAPTAAPSTMFRPAQPRPTSPTPPRMPAAPRPRGRTAAPTGQPGGGTP